MIGGRARVICRDCVTGQTRGAAIDFEDRTPVPTVIEARPRPERRGGRAQMMLTIVLAAGIGTGLAVVAPWAKEAPASVVRAAPMRAAAPPVRVESAPSAAAVDDELGETEDPGVGLKIGRGSSEANPVDPEVAELEDAFPSLSDWVHPVLGEQYLLPVRASRRFGAARSGERPAECGHGHCGVDLSGKRGTPVVAVAFGTVTRVQSDPNRRSGKYVRIQHPEGEETFYMHLDEIDPAMHRGVEVEPGQQVGILGKTGIHHSEAHLHFGLAIPEGDHMRWIDPVPFLQHATVLDEPAR